MNARRIPVAALILSACLAAPAAAAAADLGEAERLYAEAAFEEALAVLDKIALGSAPLGEIVAVHRYRAACLVALGRSADAEAAMEAIARLQPELQPARFDESPRMRDAYGKVRARVLPQVLRDLYVQARAAYTAKQPDALDRFAQVLRLADDPALAGSAATLADIKTLAEGFSELLKAAAPPEPAAPAAPVRPFYTSSDAEVVPPRVISQFVPRPPTLTNRSVAFAGTLTLELSISTEGTVENSVITQPLNPIYDAIVLDASKRWRYDPALLNGNPVPFRKRMDIVVRDDD
jgi:protein TonB